MVVEDLVMENDYVLVEAAPEKETVRDSGIIVKTLIEKDELITGKVAAISKKGERKLHLKVGDIAYLTEAGLRSRIKYDDKDYFVIRETEILAYTRD